MNESCCITEAHSVSWYIYMQQHFSQFSLVVATLCAIGMVKELESECAVRKDVAAPAAILLSVDHLVRSVQ